MVKAASAAKSNTVATPIVDKNGKQTTVHKKADNSSKADRTLPSVTNTEQSEAVSAVSKKILDNRPELRQGYPAEDVTKIATLIIAQPKSMTAEETYQATKADGMTMGFHKFAWRSIVKAGKRGWSEFVPTDGVNLLELDDEDKSLPWADRYKVKMAKLLARDGDPLSETASQYGWQDPIARSHFNDYAEGCSIAEITTLVEDEWSDFLGTEDLNAEQHGTSGQAQCACGWYRGEIRMEGTVTDFIENLRGGVVPDDIYDYSTDWIEREQNRKN